MDEAILEPLSVGDLRGMNGEPATFWVPSYQRGYRWGPREVRRCSTTSGRARVRRTTCSRSW